MGGMVSAKTTEWLIRRPKWLQVAAKRLLESGDLDDAAISDLAELCQQEANNEFPDIDCNIPAGAFDAHDSEEIRLCSISEIAGVNKLAPRKPLNFGESNVAIVYGGNGSGKSALKERISTQISITRGSGGRSSLSGPGCTKR